MANLLSKYTNGNCFVEIYDDGSKVRSWEGEASPLFPESIDYKITDYCNAGCQYCHEQSTRNGKHGDINFVLDSLTDLPPGIELAIGGGDPYSHPELDRLLYGLIGLGYVPNITVNALHVKTHTAAIQRHRKERLVYGVGISFSSKVPINHIVDENTVVHVIAGVHNVWDVLKLPTGTKILVLGYKSYGFGKQYELNNPVQKSLEQWHVMIAACFAKFHTSFDNLALSQLSIRQKIGEELWGKHFMGDDGRFTMYADAVTRSFASSSTQPRTPFYNMNIRQAFASLCERI